MQITTSLIKSWLNCPLEAYYDLQGITSKPHPGTALDRGTYLHSWLETGTPPERPEGLMEEENVIYDDLDRVYRAYEFRYRDEQLNVLACELDLSRGIPGCNHTYRGKIDKVVELGGRLWVLDHKTHQTLPTAEYRQLDIQSHAYLWLLEGNKDKLGWDLPLGGMVWDYIQPQKVVWPQLTKTGKLKLTKGSSGSTCYRSMVDWMHENKTRISSSDCDILVKEAELLKSQHCPAFTRVLVPFNRQVHGRQIKSILRWARQVGEYDWSKPPEDRNPNVCGNSYLCRMGKLAAARVEFGTEEQFLQFYDKRDPMERYK